MQVELLMIGTELLLGQIVDSNAAFMAQALAENGINLYQKTTVGDNPERIRNALGAALDRADAILCSGGLGPTEDDITRECIAELLGRPLEFRQDLYEQIVARFAQFRIPTMTENNKKQAMAPRGAIAIENPHGTAPGLIIEDARGVIVCMPGVPRELKPMMTDRVIPYLRTKFGVRGVLHSRVLKVCGIGESRVDAAMGDLIVNQRNPTVGVLAAPDAVSIRITAKADTVEEADRLIDTVDAQVRERLPGMVMGINDATLEGVVDGLLAARGWHMAVAETLTGGMIAQRLTAAGARQFAGGRVYPPGGFDLTGAPGFPKNCVEMARAVLVEYGVDCGLGLSVDSQGTSTAVGFVTPGGAAEWKVGFAGADERSQVRATVAALERVRRHLKGIPPVES